MTFGQDKMHVFNELLESETPQASAPFWSQDGSPNLRYPLLLDLLRVPVTRGDTIRSGVFANALDLWIAREFERAGFVREGMWPRAVEPRAVDPNVVHAIDAATSLNDAQKGQALHAGGAQGNANVMGSVYTKQVDVGMSSWLSGPELLISTKTMGGSFGKNLANRFEEAYGDVKNLRERYPLAAHGFFFLANASILEEPSAFEKAVHMLRQLSRNGDVYDAVALLLVSWPSQEELSGNEEDDAQAVTMSKRALDAVPKDLSCEAFFTSLIDIVLANSPIDAHIIARRLRP